jgi:hypothetical protein
MANIEWYSTRMRFGREDHLKKKDHGRGLGVGVQGMTEGEMTGLGEITRMIGGDSMAIAVEPMMIIEGAGIDRTLVRRPDLIVMRPTHVTKGHCYPT